MNKEVNYSDKILTVAGIKVLGNVENKAFQKVKDTVQNIQQSVNQVSRKAEDFWSALSQDGIISRTEKKQLKKEYESIDQTHTALMNQAREKGVENTREVLEYDFSFLELHDYLFVTLKLFDDMSKDTPIESAEVFNSYYNDYSYKLQNAQGRVNIGDPGKIRTLTSLMDEGTDGEVALYENNFYRYDLLNHEWINIEVASSLGEYQGILTSSPPMIPNQYFLVGPEGIVADTLLFDVDVRELEDNVWVDHNGEVIYINNGFEIGYIYYYDEQVKSFIKVEDKNNWRYILAMNDMIACHFEISPELYAYITQNVAADIEKRTEENVLQHIPKYLGKCNAVPGSPHNGDWMLWATTTTSRFTKSHLYLYQAATETWEELNPTSSDGKVQQMFMSALNDMLGMNDTDTEYFSTIFFDAFYGNQGSINHLNASQIDLQNGGYIQSANYEEGKTGFKIDSSGHAEFNDIEISAGYATETELNTVKQTTDTLTANVENHTQYIASLNGDVKDLADGLDSAEQATSDIVNGNTPLDNFTGQLVQDATAPIDLDDPKTWAIRTQNYHPDTSDRGFGITKDGRVFANDGQFNGELKVGSQVPIETGSQFIPGSQVKDGLIKTKDLYSSRSIRVKDSASITDSQINFYRPVLCKFASYSAWKTMHISLYEYLQNYLLPRNPYSDDRTLCVGYIYLNNLATRAEIYGSAISITNTGHDQIIRINAWNVRTGGGADIEINSSSDKIKVGIIEGYDTTNFYLSVIGSPY